MQMVCIRIRPTVVYERITLVCGDNSGIHWGVSESE